jgi:hypothetical protein
MPILGFSLLLQVACIIHIIRTGRDRIWVYVVVLLSMVGVIAYVAVEILPEIFGGRTARKLSGEMQRRVDPGREVRARRKAIEMADTTENRRLLAEALFEAGEYPEAGALYEQTLVGIHADDPVLLFGLAKVRARQGDYAGCVAMLDTISAGERSPEPMERRLFRAICLEQLGRVDDALGLYAGIVEKYPGEEVRCRYARLLASSGHHAEARAFYEEILRRAKLAKSPYRRAQKFWIDQAREGLAAAPAR